jgi:hypothetical protein
MMEQMDLFAGVRIPLYNRKGQIVAETVVDTSDAAALSQHRWFCSKAGKGYAYRAIGNPRCGTYQKIFMHREIMGLPYQKDDREVDHRNRQKLDNQRENLRIVTLAQNHQNMPSQRGSTSQYRGVYWHVRYERWIGQVKLNRRKYQVGTFMTEEAAHTAVVAARLRLMPWTIEI